MMTNIPIRFFFITSLTLISHAISLISLPWWWHQLSLASTNNKNCDDTPNYYTKCFCLYAWIAATKRHCTFRWPTVRSSLLPYVYVTISKPEFKHTNHQIYVSHNLHRIPHTHFGFTFCRCSLGSSFRLLLLFIFVLLIIQLFSS